jgi:hypothetical protein
MNPPIEHKRPKFLLGDWLRISTTGHSKSTICVADQREHNDSETIHTDRYGHVDINDILEMRRDDGITWSRE